ncbi:MAG: adenylate/guanylate cyclase domain-containing protein [Candidatus Rifleibacteriota bacterium]
MQPGQKIAILLIWLHILAVDAGAQEEKLNLVIPPSPIPWIIVAILVALVTALLTIIFIMTRKAIGEEVKIEQTKRKKVEESYASKVRSEYMAKQALLDQRLEQVRQRFSMVIVKVKHLLDTLSPDELFKAIVEMIETDIGANRYILFLLDPAKNELYPFRWSGYSEEIKKVLFIPLGHAHILTQSIKRQQTLYRAMAMNDIEIRQLIDRKPVSNTLVAVPICSQKKSFGVIHIEAFADGHTDLDENELRFLSALPTFLGGALSNADIFVQTREELTSVQKISEQEIAEKKKLKEIFSRYSSAELVETLMKKPDSIDLGGVNKQAAILFCDIAGFTNFSSKYSPKEVVSLMNEYLSRMTEIILDHQGEIDKFIGDAIMARFGVMSDLPYPGRNAVEAANAMLQELFALRNDWAARSLQTFDIRIGIATGMVLAGNIGSSRRQEFTVMGSTVNLASRLEALNKQFSTRILVDEPTFNQLPKGVKSVKRENVQIRGLDEMLNVYEILEYSGGAKVISLQQRFEQNQNIKPVVASEEKPNQPEVKS